MAAFIKEEQFAVNNHHVLESAFEIKHKIISFGILSVCFSMSNIDTVDFLS